MISLMDCLNAFYPDGITRPDGITHKHIWCSKGHKLGSGHIRKESIEKPLVCRSCQGCPDLQPFETAYEKEE